MAKMDSSAQTTAPLIRKLVSVRRISKIERIRDYRYGNKLTLHVDGWKALVHKCPGFKYEVRWCRPNSQ